MQLRRWFQAPLRATSARHGAADGEIRARPGTHDADDRPRSLDDDPTGGVAGLLLNREIGRHGGPVLAVAPAAVDTADQNPDAMASGGSYTMR